MTAHDADPAAFARLGDLAAGTVVPVALAAAGLLAVGLVYTG